MSWKSILCSIFSVLLFYGLLFATLIMFGIQVILGIVGVSLTLVLPPLLLRSAVASARGIIDRLLAKIIAPILLVLGLAAILLAFFLGGLW